MFSIVSIELSGFSLGGEVSAIGQLGMGGGPVSQDQVNELMVPWQPLQKDAGVFSLLSWHSRVSEFDGRNSEMNELERWAESTIPVSVKFVIGDGGVGKSRLGAEFAERMQDKKWSAGFVDLRNPRAFQMNKKGTLLVIDYPEEHTDKVRDLLHDLTTVGLKAKLRVLFLTRQTPDKWEETISLANARNIVDSNFLPLQRLDAAGAKTIFDSTALRASEEMESVGDDELGPAPIPLEAMDEWLKLAPVNDRALFIMAAAVHSAENPEEQVVNFDSRDVVLALVKREVERYMRLAEKNGYQDSFVYARLAAMAAIAGEINLDIVKELVSKPELELGLEKVTYLGQELEKAGVLVDGKILPPKPDILAAAFVVEVLGHAPKQAPEIVWTALAIELKAGMDRLSRLAWDAEVVLGIGSGRVQEWLSTAVKMNETRSREVLTICDTIANRYGWVEVSVVAERTLIMYSTSNTNRAQLLNNLAIHLSYVGEKEEALKSSKKAVDLSRQLSKAKPTDFEPLLAICLSNLSSRLSEMGEKAEALKAIQEAVIIYRRLYSVNPYMFEDGLAMSLNNLSNELGDMNKLAEALKAINEAVDLYRHLASANPTEFEDNLATSLNNQSIHLGELGETAAALDSINESIEIRRHLAEINPATFEPALAKNLNNLAERLRETGDKETALGAINEAVDIQRRLARAYPQAFEPHLACFLGLQGTLLSETGRPDVGKSLIFEAISLLKPHSDRFPSSEFASIMLKFEFEARTINKP